MPTAAAMVIAARRIPWSKVLLAGQYVYRKGTAARAALTETERRHFLELLKKSKGLPQNLAAHERVRIKELAAKALAGARHG